VHPEQNPVHADQFDVPHEPRGLHHVHLMTVMTENKLKTNQQQEQQQVKKWFLEPPFAVKNIMNTEFIYRLWYLIPILLSYNSNTAAAAAALHLEVTKLRVSADSYFTQLHQQQHQKRFVNNNNVIKV
jgi:hypothetical protein